MSLSRPGVPGAVLANGLILSVVTLVGVGLGAIARHTVGGIAALVGLIILPALLEAARQPKPAPPMIAKTLLLPGVVNLS